MSGNQDGKAGSYLPLRMFLDRQWGGNKVAGADKNKEREQVKRRDRWDCQLLFHVSKKQCGKKEPCYEPKALEAKALNRHLKLPSFIFRYPQSSVSYQGTCIRTFDDIIQAKVTRFQSETSVFVSLHLAGMSQQSQHESRQHWRSVGKTN